MAPCVAEALSSVPIASIVQWFVALFHFCAGRSMTDPPPENVAVERADLAIDAVRDEVEHASVRTRRPDVRLMQVDRERRRRDGERKNREQREDLPA